MESYEYAPGRTILAPNGEEYQVQDIITGGSGNDWLVITQDRDLDASGLVMAGHVRDTWFAVEPDEPVDTSPVAQAQADAERLRNEKRRAKAEKKARKSAESKKAKKAAKKTAAKPTAKTPTAKKTAAKKTPARKPSRPGSGTQTPTAAAPGPAAVSV